MTGGRVCVICKRAGGTAVADWLLKHLGYGGNYAHADCLARVRKTKESTVTTDEPPELIPPAWRGQIAAARLLPDGQLLAIEQFIFTTGLLINVRFDGERFYDYDARYCYEHGWEAVIAMGHYRGDGDPLGPWIKEKISGRLGPGARMPE